MKTKRKFFFVLRNENEKERFRLKLKRKRKMKKVEKIRKRLCTNELKKKEKDLKDVVIYTKEVKEKKEG